MGGRAYTLLVEGMPPLSALTKAEASPGWVVARGLSDAEIAVSRGRAPEQVTQEVAALCQRIGVANRV